MSANLNSFNPPLSEVAEIVTRGNFALRALAGKRVLILGGTGFIGTWLKAAFLEANRNLSLGLTVSTVSRKKTSKVSLGRGFSRESLDTVFLDLEFDYYDIGSNFDVVFLLANSNSADQTSESFVRIRKNLSRSLNTMANSSGGVPHVIHASSGAVYGRSRPRENCIPESTNPTPDSGDLYAIEKLALERHLNKLNDSGVLRIASPRIFATYGPGLPTGKHFAIGNFVKSKVNGKPIHLSGHPETRRSYIYITDLIVYLLKISASPTNLPLNLGAPDSVSILELAEHCAVSVDKQQLQVTIPKSYPEKTAYFPCVDNLISLYGDEFTANLETGLERWANWLQTNRLT
jgi:UDP-glucuronate decarboxylase